MQVGYVKDAIAAVMFLISIVYVSKVKIDTIRFLLVCAFIVDLLFTVNPDWHCEDWNQSRVSKYIVLLQIPIFCANIPW